MRSARIPGLWNGYRADIFASKSPGENAVCIQSAVASYLVPADRVEANSRCNTPREKSTVTNCNVTELDNQEN
jgi:hypothetical protein